MRIVYFVLAAMLTSIAAKADIYYIPPALSPGETYQLVFVTADSFPATSTNIADYNNFVSAEAAAAPTLAVFDALYGVTWPRWSGQNRPMRVK